MFSQNNVQSKEELEHQRQLLYTARRRLRVLELQRTQEGYQVRPQVITEIETLELEIKGYENKITELQKILDVQDITAEKLPNKYFGNKNIWLSTIIAVIIFVVLGIYWRTQTNGVNMPTATAVISSPTTVSMAVLPLATNVPTVTTSTIVELSQLNRRNLYTTGGASFSPSSENGEFKVLGAWYQRVWLDKEMPKEFCAYIDFKMQTSQSQFNMGLGKGGSKSSNYVFVMRTKSSQPPNQFPTEFLRFFEDASAPTELANSSEGIDDNELNRIYSIKMERQDGQVRFYLNGDLLFSGSGRLSNGVVYCLPDG